MRLIPTFFILLSVQFSFAQNDKLGTWNIVNFKYNTDQKWSVWAESQTRSQLFFNNFFYYEIKGGFGYSIDKNFSLLFGTGRYATYSNDGNFKKPFANEEFRLWEQVTMNQYLDRLKFEHRYRIEQRWLANGGYRNRFRYRLNAVLPLKNKRLDPKTFYLTAFDEVFLTNVAPYFERNRIFGGVGYKFNSAFVLQPGYIYQFDYRADNTKSGKGFFQVALFIELEKHKSFHEKLPSSVD
jgi:hypothetical protein